MIDVTKVIKALECCADMHTAGPGYAQGCAFCPYNDTPSDGANGYACIRKLFADVKYVLKTQEPVIPTWRQGLEKSPQNYKFCGGKLKCALGNHRYRAADIKCVSMGNDLVSVEQTCMYCGFTEHFLTRLSTHEDDDEQTD